MSNKVMAVLLPVGSDAQPIPVAISDIESIQHHVGGYFECVTMEYDPHEMFDEVSTETKFVCVGYVHEEGRMLNLEPNELASTIFNQQLVGNVVIVSGTSPKGEYDGESYDLPEWFINGVFTHLRSAVSLGNRLNAVMSGLKKFLVVAIEDGLATSEEITEMVMRAALEGSAEDMETIQALSIYGYKRIKGEIPEPQVSEPLPTEWEITDEEIQKFLAETNKGE
jgi:hypothetical protein